MFDNKKATPLCLIPSIVRVTFSLILESKVIFAFEPQKIEAQEVVAHIIIVHRAAEMRLFFILICVVLHGSCRVF